MEQNERKYTTSSSIDPSSGKFIVADILPPRSVVAETVASRQKVKRIQKKSPAITSELKNSRPIFAGRPLTQPRKQVGETLGREEANSLFQSKDSSALTAWYRKEKDKTEKSEHERPQTTTRSRSILSTNNKTKASTSLHKKYVYGIFILLVVLLVGGYGLALFSSKLYVVINVRAETVPVSHELIISSDITSADISGELISATQSKEQEFTASGKEDVRNKARGTILIYNAYNSNPQILVANTRFQDEETGNIYRIQESVTIPGARIENGQLFPSSIEAVVYADQPGEDYNSNLTDFTIPGFKGSPRFEGFYARAKTPMDGGFIGNSSVVTQNDIDKARELVEVSLREAAIQELRTKSSLQSILLEGSYEITTDSRSFNKEVGDAAESFILSTQVSARAIVFLEDDLTRALSDIASIDYKEVAITNIQDLTLRVIRRNIEDKTMILRVEGDAHFVGTIDNQGLRNKLMEIPAPSESELTAVFQQYPAIESAEVRFSPSWIKRIPKISDKIILEITE